MYGNALFSKIKKISKLLNKEIDVETPDIIRVGHYTKMYGYLVQVQLSNISKVEEFDMMEIMDKYRKFQENNNNEHTQRVQEIPSRNIEKPQIIPN